MALSISIEILQLYFFTYSFLFSLGNSLLLASSCAILPHYFDKKISLANGVVNSLATLVTVVIPVFTDLIRKAFGVKGVFSYLTAVSLVSIFFTLTFKSVLPKNPTESKLKRFKESFGLEVLKKRDFIVWCVGASLGMVGYYVPIMVFVSYKKYMILFLFKINSFDNFFLRITIRKKIFRVRRRYIRM